MSGTKLSAELISVILNLHIQSKSIAVIPNIWLHGLGGESDIVRISDKRYLFEYEIKTSMADYNREKKKEKWTTSNLPKTYRTRKQCRNVMLRGFYFVVPHSIADHVDADVKVSKLWRSAGVIGVSPYYCTMTKKCGVNKNAQPLDKDQIIDIMRRISNKYWYERERKLIQL